MLIFKGAFWFGDPPPPLPPPYVRWKGGELEKCQEFVVQYPSAGGLKILLKEGRKEGRRITDDGPLLEETRPVRSRGSQLLVGTCCFVVLHPATV